MRRHITTTSIAIASTCMLLASRAPLAQKTPASVAATATTTDARWLPWLGCWAPDTAANGVGAARTRSSSITCIVPSKGARGVDALTIVRGKIAMRDRIDAGRPHTIDGQGCRGTETANWSATGHRVYLHADYVCGGGTTGRSATIFALTSNGEWLRVEQVRSGNGSIVSVDHLRPVDPPASLGAETAGTVEGQQRAITTARAGAALPITTDEIVDAVHALDADVVRSWVAASNQTFDVDPGQIDALARAGVPVPVLDAIAAASPALQSAIAAGSQRSADVYSNSLNTQAAIEPAPQMTTMRVCPPNGCGAVNPYSAYNGYGYGAPIVYPYGYLPYFYAAPVIVRSGAGRGRGPVGRAPAGHGIDRGVDHGIQRGGPDRFHPPSRPTPPKSNVITARRRGPS